MLVQNFPQAFQEKHLLKGFSVKMFVMKNCADSLRLAPAVSTQRLHRHCGTARRGGGIRTFGCCYDLRIVLKTPIQEYGNGLHDPPKKSE